MNFEPISINRNVKEYWEGKENKIIRVWVYLQRGLQMVNEFKYVLAAIISLYVILKINHPVLMVVVALATIPPLIILGKWQLRKVAKISEWVGAIYGSVIGYSSYNCQIETLKILKEILAKLNNNGGKIDAVSVGKTKEIYVHEASSDCKAMDGEIRVKN